MQMLSPATIKAHRSAEREHLERELLELSEAAQTAQRKLWELKDEYEAESSRIEKERAKVLSLLETDKRALEDEIKALEEEKKALETSDDAKKLAETLKMIEQKETELDVRLSETKTESDRLIRTNAELDFLRKEITDREKELHFRLEDLQKRQMAASNETQRFRAEQSEGLARLDAILKDLSEQESRLRRREEECGSREGVLKVLEKELAMEKASLANDRRQLQDSYAQIEKSKKELYGQRKQR